MLTMELARVVKSFHNRLATARAHARGSFLRLSRGPALEGGAGLALGRGVEVEIYGTLRLGRDVLLASGAYLCVGPGAVLEIGDGVFVGRQTVIVASRSIRIGAHTAIAEHCSIRDSDHDTDAQRRREDVSSLAPVEIGDDCWIGAGVRVLRGSHLDARVVVGANAVVRGTFESAVVVAGVPARIVKRLAG